MADVRQLAELIEQYAGIDGIHTTAIPRVILYRASQIEEPMHAVYEPAVCIVAQGRKQSIAGEDIYVYDRSEEHTSELQSHSDLVCRLLLEKKRTHLRT